MSWKFVAKFFQERGLSIFNFSSLWLESTLFFRCEKVSKPVQIKLNWQEIRTPSLIVSYSFIIQV